MTTQFAAGDDDDDDDDNERICCDILGTPLMLFILPSPVLFTPSSWLPQRFLPAKTVLVKTVTETGLCCYRLYCKRTSRIYSIVALKLHSIL